MATQPSVARMESSAGRADLFEVPPPLSEEGFFEGREIDGLAIDEWSEPSIDVVDGVGTLNTRLVSLKDGSVFVFRKMLPSDQKHDISVDFTPPLATHVKGFNTDLAIDLGVAGIHSRIVGTNQTRGFDLHHDVAATLLILHKDDSVKDPTSSPDQSVSIGYSMGLMKALGIAAAAPIFGREVHATMGLDACLAKRIDYREQVSELPNVVRYVGNELGVLGQKALKDVSAGSIADRFRKTKTLWDTFRPTPKHALNTLDKWNTLASGETGSFIAHIPTEAVVIMNFFDGSRLNDSAVYEALFANHPNFRSIHEAGVHFSGAEDEVIEEVVRNASAALSLIKGGRSGSELADALSRPVLMAA